MIFDQLLHADCYRKLSPRIAAALDYLEHFDPDATAAGKYELDGDRLYAVVAQYTTRPLDESIWEAHQRYIDVQYIAQGCEWMGYQTLRDGLPVKTPYDAGKDAAFFDLRGDMLRFEAGMFAILWPHDIHAPGLAAGAPSEVTKVVVKIRIDA